MAALLEKFKKVQFVLANAKLINFLMEMETAILVDQTNSFPMVNAFVLLDTVATAVEFALFHADKDNSLIKEDAQSVPSTPSIKLKSMDVIAQLATTKISLEFVKNLS